MVGPSFGRCKPIGRIRPERNHLSKKGARMPIYQMIREGRRRLGMNEEQFAKAVGVTRGAVQQWEKPDGTSPKRGNMPRVAEVLHLSLAELMSNGANVQTLSARAEVPLVSEVEAGDYTVIDNFGPGTISRRCR